MDRQTLIATLNTSAPAVRVALATLHARQTTDEQRGGTTRHRNGQGFNANDAAFLSDLAERVTHGHRLSARQNNAARQALVKYAGQLLASGVDWERFVVAQRKAGELREMEELAVELGGGAK